MRACYDLYEKTEKRIRPSLLYLTANGELSNCKIIWARIFSDVSGEADKIITFDILSTFWGTDIVLRLNYFLRLIWKFENWSLMCLDTSDVVPRLILNGAKGSNERCNEDLPTLLGYVSVSPKYQMRGSSIHSPESTEPHMTISLSNTRTSIRIARIRP